MLHKPEGLKSKSILMVPFPKGCLIIYIHIVLPTKLNDFWCLLFDLSDNHEGTQVLTC